MLRAYDYAESDADKRDINDAALFHREKQIAQNYVVEHPLEKEIRKCPVCDSENTKYIFQRWDINYRFCMGCSSIYVPVEEKIISGYLELDEMKSLRNSEEYQKQASERRAVRWEDLVLWAEFRAYRYLGCNESLDVIDYGNKYSGLVDKFRKSKLAGNYELRHSILPVKTEKAEMADIALFLNQLQHEIDPVRSLRGINKDLKDEGILVLTTRLGSGFDILTLKGGTPDIFPYEHVMLPSKKGLEIILEKAGFELLEITTPGTRDMDIVMKNKERIEDTNFFIKYLLENADERIMMDFQQYLQKSGLSSFAQVVARKKSQ